MIMKIHVMICIILILRCRADPIKSDVSPSVHSNKKNHVALILARGGSKGIVKKNLALLENKSLLRRTIEAALKAEVFDAVWVSTDDLNIYKEAEYSGANVFGRSELTSSDTASSLSAVQEFYEFFPKLNFSSLLLCDEDVTTIALLQCTSPFQSAFYLRKAFHLMEDLQYDSVFTVTRSRKLRWKQSSNGTWQPLNFDEKFRPRRQIVNEFIENGMFYWFNAKLLNNGALQGGKIGVVEVPPVRSLEIDSYHDLEYAKYLAAKLFPIIKSEEGKCFLEERSWLNAQRNDHLIV